MYQVETFPVGQFQCNCSIVANPDTRQAIVVDPGEDFDVILDRLDAKNLSVQEIWHTHAHIDHVGATQALWEECTRRALEKGESAPRVWLHEADRWLYENVPLQAQFLRLPAFTVDVAFQPIKEGQGFPDFPGLRSLHTPGHTPGSCCLEIAQSAELEAPRSFLGRETSAPRLVLSGDTLFRRGIGRTDLWGGDSALIERSIQRRLYSLPEETVVIPGHGPFTRIAEEREKNPFVQVASR